MAKKDGSLAPVPAPSQSGLIDDNSRSWVTEKEVATLMSAAKKTRHSVRNQLIIMMLYRHGLRESELCNLRLSQLDLDTSHIFIKRLKGGVDMNHPIPGDELRLIRRYLQTCLLYTSDAADD